MLNHQRKHPAAAARVKSTSERCSQHCVLFSQSSTFPACHWMAEETLRIKTSAQASLHLLREGDSSLKKPTSLIDLIYHDT